MSQEIVADLCIIGAGSGGLSIAAGAAQLGRRVVLIEKGEMGGDCLNYGCVPSKALLAAAAKAQSFRTASKFGIGAEEPVVDFAAVMDHVRGVIKAIEPHDSQERFEGLGCTVIRAHGAFTGPDRLAAGGKTVRAKRFVIATGSSPFVPPIPGLAETPHLTNETIFSNRTKPRHLIVVGGGPIGVELAQAHRRLGSNVTIIEAMTILNRDDPDAVAVARENLTAEGVDIIEKIAVAKTSKRGDDIVVTLADGREIEGSHLLIAVGRRANLGGLGLEKAGVAVDDKGRLILDGRLRSSNRRVYAVGDAAGGLQFTHVAGDHASTFVRNVLFKAPTNRRDALAPKVTYCDPEVASVGLVGDEATAKHPDAEAIVWRFTENDRAVAERRTDGFLKAFVRPNGEILGATMVGVGAGEGIALWSFAIANKLKIRAFTNFIAAYPTRSEISKRAGGAFYTPTLFSKKTRGVVKLLATFD